MACLHLFFCMKAIVYLVYQDVAVSVSSVVACCVCPIYMYMDTG